MTFTYQFEPADWIAFSLHYLRNSRTHHRQRLRARFWFLAAFLAFGRENTTFGQHRLTIPLPANCTYPGIMATGYYAIGKLQAQKPAWFKESIESFAERASKAFGQKIEPIVKFK